jgi:hypothetical protein
MPTNENRENRDKDQRRAAKEWVDIGTVAGKTHIRRTTKKLLKLQNMIFFKGCGY